MLSRESQPCLLKMKKYAFSVFFLSRASRFCFRERHGYAFARVTAVPLGNEKKRIFCFFFHWRESRFCFRGRHNCDFVRGTGVPLSKREKKSVLRVRFFHTVLFMKKSSSKPINMGSNFEDLDARNPTVKAVQDLDARIREKTF